MAFFPPLAAERLENDQVLERVDCAPCQANPKWASGCHILTNSDLNPDVVLVLGWPHAQTTVLGIVVETPEGLLVLRGDLLCLLELPLEPRDTIGITHRPSFRQELLTNHDRSESVVKNRRGELQPVVRHLLRSEIRARSEDSLAARLHLVSLGMSDKHGPTDERRDADGEHGRASGEGRTSYGGPHEHGHQPNDPSENKKFPSHELLLSVFRRTS